MKIQEGLVFDSSCGEIVGYVDVGDINNKITSLEQRLNSADDPIVADHMLAIMVRGIFIKLDFTLGSFPTKGKLLHV